MSAGDAVMLDKSAGPKTKSEDVIPPELEEDNPVAEELARYIDDPHGLEEPDEWGLGNSWDWAGGD